MKARHNYCTLLALVTAIALFTLPAAAQSPIRVTENVLTFNLPESVIFSLAANSPSDIQQVTLIFDTEARSCQESIARRPMQITPGKSIDTQWEMDFQQMGALLPGQQVWWQWQIVDSAGNRLLTDKQSLTIQDQRHDWQTAKNGPVTLQWYRGDESFGRQMAQVAAEAQQRLIQDTGIAAPTPIRIVLYPDSRTLKEVLVHATEWTGGVALPGQGVILLAISPSDTRWAESSIPHEISHLVFDQQTANCAGVSTPAWLNEGLAERLSSDLSDSDRQLVIDTLEKNRLKSLKSLSGAFSAYSDEARRDYTHSRMVVDFLIDQYGSEAMSRLLAAFQEGTDTDEALRSVYSLDTAGLDAAWRSSLGFAPAPAQPTSASVQPTTIPTLALWTPVVRPSPSPIPPTITPTAAFTPPPPTADPGGLAPAASQTPTAGAAGGRSGGLCGGLLPILAAAVWLLWHHRRLRY